MERLGAVPVGGPEALYEVSVVDEEGRTVPDGEVGEIVVTSCRSSSGYWGRRTRRPPVSPKLRTAALATGVATSAGGRTATSCTWGGPTVWSRYAVTSWSRPRWKPPWSVQALARRYVGEVWKVPPEGPLLPRGAFRRRGDRVGDGVSQYELFFEQSRTLLHRYRPRPWRGPTAVFLGRASEENGDTLDWSGLLTGPSEVRHCSGDHLTIYHEPHARTFAKELEEALQGHQGLTASGR